ncbi:ABC transporter ATP-binding protein [Streptomyces luteogriseus]|uniref:ABC transporter ATP-binding protein n=1 Tax=Streptomyces luteogriseus TaxID=68233 RepID=UPI0033D595DF
MSGDWAVELHGVRKRYGRGSTAVHALRGIDLTLRHGSCTAVMGPSGSGKSTFLQCAAGLDRPTAGTVRLGGTEITGMKENKLTALRRTRIGFVFQAFNLLPSLTVEQNVVLPMRLAGHRPDRRRAAEVLEQVGLADKARRRPGQLSGGQQQRVAIARALVTRPDVVFADEPTGALDTTTATEILTLLREAVDTHGATVVMVTHDPAAAAWADRVLFLSDGEIVDHLDRDDTAGGGHPGHGHCDSGHPGHGHRDSGHHDSDHPGRDHVHVRRAHADRIAARMTSLAVPRARAKAAA